MDVTVVITPNFKREAKKLTKKYRSLKGELEVLIEDNITKVYLLSIYDKSDTENISEKLLKQLTHGVQQTIAEENAFDLLQKNALEQNEEHSEDDEVK